MREKRYLDIEKELALCTICEVIKPFEMFGRLHTVSPPINYHCKDCVNKRVKAWYQNNKERTKQRVAAWQKNNKERHHAYMKKWRENNPDAVKKYYREYFKENKEAIKETQKRYWIKRLRREGYTLIPPKTTDFIVSNATGY